MRKTHRSNLKSATIAAIATVAVVGLLIGPSAVLAQSERSSDAPMRYRSQLTKSERRAARQAKIATRTRRVDALQRTTPRRATPIPEPQTTRVATNGRTLTSTSGGGATSIDGGSTGTNELAQAQSILAGYISRYPILAGSTVTIGSTPGGHQAVAYYTVGKIVISSSHTASLQTIIGHEIWHIIDYRDNGQIDWGESVPPANYP